MTVRIAFADGVDPGRVDQSDPLADSASAQQHAVRLVREFATAMERRILDHAGQSCEAPDSGSLPPWESLQDQLVHLARVAALGTLAASIAHEIRQPLTAIRVETYAMHRWMNRETPNTAEVAEGIRRIQAQSERAEQVIRSLRALMRREPAVRHPFPLDQAILEILPLVEARIYDADVTLELDLDASLPALHGDRVQIQQVVLNLLLNAVDALRGAPHGGATVALRVGGAGPGMAVLEVADNGPGIDPARIGQIFEPFVSTKSDGMGLGLAICRMIVEAHGGTVQAASADGRTAMTAYLPLQAQ